MKYLMTALLFLCGVVQMQAQTDTSKKRIDDELLQFTGIILSPDSLQAIPDVSIRINNSNTGAVSSVEGFFSLVAKKGDTLHFTGTGLRPEKYVIPASLKSKKYTMIQTMSQDTLYLNQVIVRPYISPELFQHYFVTLEVPEDAGDVALENLDPETIREYAEAMKMDGTENQKYYLRQESGKYYYAGQLPPINLLNPFAWAQFIKAWKAGKLKRQ